MKRNIRIIILLILFILCSCNNKKTPTRTIKIGIIDSCISETMIQNLKIKEYNMIEGGNTNNDITHGSMITSIIKQEVQNCEIYYCSVYDESCVGTIENIETAINWCIENEVDVISMSFATLEDDTRIRESIKTSINSNIVVIASCINLSDITCYPAMYNGVISVSEGFNPQAKIILKGKKVVFAINKARLEKREVSFLTAYVSGEIAKQLSMGKNIEEILDNLDFL